MKKRENSARSKYVTSEEWFIFFFWLYVCACVIRNSSGRRMHCEVHCYILFHCPMLTPVRCVVVHSSIMEENERKIASVERRDIRGQWIGMMHTKQRNKFINILVHCIKWNFHHETFVLAQFLLDSFTTGGTKKKTNHPKKK